MDKRRTMKQAKKLNPAIQTRLQYLFLFLLAFLIYSNTLTHGFVLDDTLMITQNKFTKEGVKGIPDILSHDALTGFFGEEKNLLPGGRYRPLSQVMFAVEYQLFGLKPFPGHLINVLLYALASLALFSLLKRLLDSGQPSSWIAYLPFMTTAIFICHPLHTEVVANIKGRDEILALWAFIGTAWFTLRYFESKSVYNLVWVALIAFLGLLAKESAITYLVAVPLTIYFFRKANFKTTILLAIPFLVSILAYFLLRYSLFGPIRTGIAVTEILNNPFAGESAADRLATVFMTWLKYFGLILFPHPLTHDYYPHHLRVVDFTNLAAIIGALLSIALLVFALIRLPKRDPWAWCILFFFVVFSIYSNLLINIGAFMNERFVFLPLLGFSLALAMAFQKISTKLGGKKPATVMFVLMFVTIGFYSGKTMVRNKAWESNLTLFTTDVKVSKNSAKCNVSAGEALIDEAMLPSNAAKKSVLLTQAERYLLAGAELHPRYYGAWDKLSLAYVYQEKWSQAIAGYRNCMHLRANDPVALRNLKYIGDQCLRNENYEMAREAMRLVLTQHPSDSLGLYALGVADLKQGNADSAFYYLTRTIEVAPRYANAWNMLAEAEGRFHNDLNKAGQYLALAYSIEPDNASVLENLGVLAGMKEQPREALEWFLKSYDQNPDNINVIRNIVTSYQALGDVQKAAEWNRKLSP